MDNKGGERTKCPGAALKKAGLSNILKEGGKPRKKGISERHRRPRKPQWRVEKRNHESRYQKKNPEVWKRERGVATKAGIQEGGNAAVGLNSERHREP